MEREAKIRTLATEQFANEEIEFDLNAEVSEAPKEGGAWVQAWVWVNFEGTELEKPE